jgi:hypothetical protein
MAEGEVEPRYGIVTPFKRRRVWYVQWRSGPFGYEMPRPMVYNDVRLRWWGALALWFATKALGLAERGVR